MPSVPARSALAGAAAVLLAAGPLLVADAAAQSAGRSAPVRWKPCPADDPHHGAALRGLDCGTLSVPLDHDDPGGERITLALTRARHTAPRSQGALLLNPGGPGASGRPLAGYVRSIMPKDVAASYDWIGFDPRGVGASKPALVCDRSYQDPGRARPDTTPANRAEELAWIARARTFAADCQRRYGRYLPHMGTAASVRDLEAVRVALDAPKLNYLGYSYGTYLGAAYASRYPDRTGRMVLDSVVRPSNVWYDANLSQNVAFEKRIRAYFAWIARHHAVYGLGRTPEAVRRAYDTVRARLERAPLGGRVGPSELDDIFLNDGYTDRTWPSHARALADFVRNRDGAGLRRTWERPTWLDQNNYTVYNAVQCRDAGWPRDWETWHDDTARQYRAGYRFLSWSNAWYNAPCAFWAVPGGPPPTVGGPTAPLLVQSEHDAATPYPGAAETHRLFPASRLLVQKEGGNHGLTGDGDRCVDGAVAAYLRDGTLPPDRVGPDAVCAAPPRPEPRRETGTEPRAERRAGDGERGAGRVPAASPRGTLTS